MCVSMCVRACMCTKILLKILDFYKFDIGYYPTYCEKRLEIPFFKNQQLFYAHFFSYVQNTRTET